MDKLLQGLSKFKREEFLKNQKLYESLAQGQSPRALFITCSDSRVDPNRLMQTEPGELFIQRTAGNIVPPFGAVNGGEAATIEYAVSVLKVKHIIVCGHTHCGAMAGLLAPDSLNGLPAVRLYLEHAQATRRILEENHHEISDPQDRLMLAVEENVLVQLENLRTHPSVAATLGRSELSLHAWVYKFENGEVLAYDRDARNYRPIQSDAFPVSEPDRIA